MDTTIQIMYLRKMTIPITLNTGNITYNDITYKRLYL
jgi:hypothetical protein